MKRHLRVICISFFLIHFGLLAQSKDDFYNKWRVQMDTLTNLQSRLKLSKKMLYKVDELYKTEIYMHLGKIYSKQDKLDSSLFFYNKGKVLGESQGEKAEEYLELIYIHTADILLENNRFDDAKILLEKAKKILIKNPEHNAWSHYYGTYAGVTERSSKYAESIKYMDSAIAFSKKNKDTFALAPNYHNRGFFHYNLTHFEDAAQDFIKAVELNKKYNKLNDLAGNYYVLSNCYVALSQFQLAKKYSIEGVAVSNRAGNKYVASLNYSILSESYRELNETDDALVATDSMLVLAYELKNDSQIAQGLTDKAGIYLHTGQEYDKAEAFYLEAYAIVEASNIEVYKHAILGGLADVYLARENYPKAAKFLKLEEENIEKLSLFTGKQGLYESYSQYYEKTGQLNLALKYLKNYHQIKDSISSEKIKVQVAKLEKQYDTKKKELQIVELDKEKTEQEQLTEKAKTKQGLYLLVVVVLFSFLIMGFWLFKKLKKQKEELDATNTVKNRLFSIIAHDLRGMIIPFQRSGRILQHYIENKDYNKTIMFSQELQKNSEGLSNTLDNLLNWSLEQMNGYKMNPELLLLSKELEEIKSNFSQQETFKNTKISIINTEEVAFKIDKGAFHIIFRNLIGNALKYTEDGRIRVEFKRELKLLKCSVIDTGVGMSSKQLDTIFSIENKESSSGTKGEKGSGLGLNLVYRFIEMNGGTINVSSERRVGTKFNFSFPLSEYDIIETKKVNIKEKSA